MTKGLFSEQKKLTKQGEEPEVLNKEWVSKQIGDAKKKVLSDAKEEIAKQVQIDKASLITVFGIFASIISFLTIEFQFLRTVCSFQKVLGFTMILSSMLLNFNIVLDYLIKSRIDKKTPKPNMYFVFYIVSILAVGIVFSLFGNEQLCKENEIYQKYQEQSKIDFGKVINDLDRKILSHEAELEKIKKRHF